MRHQSSSPIGRLLIGALLLLGGLGGCIRAGFDFAGNGPGVADGAASVDQTAKVDGVSSGDRGAGQEEASMSDDLGSSPPGGVTSANDTCATPARVDLQPLASGGKVSLEIDAAGAKNDYTDSCCEGDPDLVVQLANLPSRQVTFRCTGSGAVTTAIPTTSQSGACPPTGGFNCNTVPCGTGVHRTNLNGSYLLVCRAAAAGPGTLTLE